MNKRYLTDLLGLNSTQNLSKPIRIFFLVVLMISYSFGTIQGQTTTVTFNFTGAVQSWVVPPCVTSINVVAEGGEGGGSGGGNGAIVSATIPVIPGQTLQIRVGGMGVCPGTAYNGGGNGPSANTGANAACGGGGASDIRVTPFGLGNRIIVAGGGGGTGGGDTDAPGGGGGCTTGLNGTSTFGQGGWGGTLIVGGAGGGPWGGGASGQAGSLGQGGNGAADPCYNRGPGGGGGGGYYGGGGGGSDCYLTPPLGGGGGGGGSSFIPAGGTCSAGINTGTGVVTITYVPGAMVSTATNTGPYCAGATIQLNSGAGGIDYDWIGPGGYVQNNTQNPTIVSSTVAMSGVYTVTVTFAGGCTSTATTTVVVNPSPTPTATNTGPYCSGQTIQLNSPTGSGTDDWAGPGGYTSINTQNPTIPSSTVAMSGVYTVTVTNGSGCSATATTTVVVNLSASASASNTGPYCEGAMISLSSGAGAIDYDWTGPGGYIQNNTQNPTIPGSTIAMSGTYTVFVTMVGGCTGTATTTVTVNPLPTPTATNTGPYCAGQTIQLNSPAGSGTDDWAGPGGYTSINTQNPTIPSSTVGMSGVYTVTVTNASGCSATATTSVTVNALPTPTATNTGPYCAGATIQLNSPTGSATDDWVGPGGYNQINTQNPVILNSTPAMSGIYTVTVTNLAGCSATATTSVTVNSAAVPIANNTGPYCAGTTINLSSAGGNDYDWTGPGGYVQNNTQNPTIPGSTVGMNGTYTVLVTTSAGCNGTATTTVIVNALPTPTANNTGPYCTGAAMDLSSSGGLDFDWSGPGGFILNNTQNGSIPNSNTGMTGTYTVNVTDANGCSVTATTIVTVNPLPNAVANNSSPICEFQTINLTSGGGVNYDWTGPNGYNNSGIQNPTITNAPMITAGVYTVTVTDANGCVSTATTTVVVNPNPVISASNNSPICAGFTLNLTADNLLSATYNWAGPNGFNAVNQQNPNILGVTSAGTGTYTVTVTTTGGCTGTATTNAVINENPVPLFSGDILSGCAPICVNFTDQSTVNGSTIASWNWNIEGEPSSTNQNTSACFDNPGQFDVTLTVTCGLGCVSTLNIPNYITAHVTPVADFMYTPDKIFIFEPLVTFGNTSTGATSYLWDFGDGNTSLSMNPTHTYSDTGYFCVNLLATTAFGCLDTITHCLYVAPEFSLYIPNSFTPNDDQINEIWNIYGMGVKSISVNIFDRWGEEIFAFTDIEKGWPGTRQNGNICQQGVYVYRIEVFDSNNHYHEYYGLVNLIR